MTIRIRKSVADATGFERAVAAHIEALEIHRFKGDAQPTASDLVEQAIRRIQYDIDAGKPDDFVPDYEIEDDTPPPPSAAELKIAALNESRLKEQADIAAIMPSGKRRLFEMDVQRAQSVPVDERSVEVTRLLNEWGAFQGRIQQIQYEAAQREALIDDMFD